MSEYRPEPLKWVFWLLVAAMLLVVAAGRLVGQPLPRIDGLEPAFPPATERELETERRGAVVATAHPQPRPSKHVRVWHVTVCNYTAAPVVVTEDRLFQEFGGRLAILNTFARSYEQTRTPKSVIGRVGDGLANAGIAFAAATGSGAIEYDGPWTTAALVYGGAWKIARLVLKESDNLQFTGQPFWDGRKVQLDAGGDCFGAAMAVLRPEDKAERKRLERSSLGVAFRDWTAPPEVSLSGTWDRPPAFGFEPEVSYPNTSFVSQSPCLIRPSSVEDEGCGRWYR